ncbi:MAG: GTPase HflX [Gemmatimonadales bacterium]
MKTPSRFKRLDEAVTRKPEYHGAVLPQPRVPQEHIDRAPFASAALPPTAAFTLTSEGRRRRRLTATEADLGIERQRAFLVGVISQGRHELEADLSLQELGQLTLTAGSDPEGSRLVRRDRIDPATFIGKGQAEDLAREATAADIDVVVFDNSLSPVQQRNLQAVFGCDVVDRTALILDIFAQHASSRAGMLQVELAQLRYRMPRLRGRGITLSRLAGGIGTRGPGETKLETDRRRIATRISKLERELGHIGQVRRTQRKARLQSDITTVALVGYTNAGKSSLLNALTDADILTGNQLFSTLDPTVRRLELEAGTVLLSDTVGFVRELPHELVEAFRSSLEQVSEAVLLLHVVDTSDVAPERQISAVHDVLSEIDARGIPELLVFNKIDLVEPHVVQRLLALYDPAIAVSALEGLGLERLRTELAEAKRADHIVAAFVVPYDHGEVVAALHQQAEVLEETFEPEATHLKVRGPRATLASFAEYRI